MWTGTLIPVVVVAGVAITVMLGGLFFVDPDPDEKVLKQIDIQDMKEVIQKEIQEMIHKEIQDIKKNQSDEQKGGQTSQVEQYKKGELEVTPEMLSSIISTAVEKTMKQQNDRIQEKLDILNDLEEKLIERLDEHNRKEETPKLGYQPSPENDIGEKLHKIEKLLLERKSNNFNYSYYVDIAMTNISSAISTIKNLSDEVYVLISSKSAPLLNAVSFGYFQDHPIILSVIAFVLSLVLDILVVYCLCRVCSRFRRRKKITKPEAIKIGGKELKHVFTSKPPSFSSDSSLKRSFQKLENSICALSFSRDVVEKYHLPLVKSLSEVLSDWKLQTKRVLILKPDDLNVIPPSKIFVVFVDFNEKNEILESDVTRKGNLLIKRETVRSLMDSFALVILVYCLEASSEKLAFGDRYAHKLHNKVTSVDELRMLSDKHCMYSVYKKFNEFQLGSLKQTMQEYLQEIKEIVS
ncbi:uncharacterized protein LOC130051864 [Ostrea edulis]|uniref:uncharacterized protein LOC130051864 n=1 Tax=Ostrea edulis TaxID=37623 RepID=UPI0024AF4A51|nr:uncharacterized protein LOC130051864 [Ostrea edulis]XP_056010808.1 uncharacterized protein LOC130051864 [Ostrea edulis]